MLRREFEEGEKLTEDQLTMVFWMLEFMNIGRQITKEKIEKVIEVSGGSIEESDLRKRILAL